MPLRESPITPDVHGPSISLQIVQELKYALGRMIEQRGYGTTIRTVELEDYRHDEDGNLQLAVKAPAIVLSWRTTTQLANSGGAMGCGFLCDLTVDVNVAFEMEEQRRTSETVDQVQLDVLRALLELPEWCRARISGQQTVTPAEDNPNAFSISVAFEFTTNKTFFLSS